MIEDDDRPTPEQMLARIKTEGEADTAARKRGRLKVYFGYAAGVGKTYSMLQNAQHEKAAGVDVVVGYVEPHGRLETEALLEGLEQLPCLEAPYRGTMLREFDVDAALARCPGRILVDELAHTNAASMRHVKRWQDIEELLTAGIDVDTTCNVQHVESLNDIVAQISGVIVRETVPDEVFNRADELALIDISPEDLLERLREGKVYIPAQAERALANFFRRDNLMALRELSLRRTAERVHADVETARLARAARDVWATQERLLVCVGPSPTSAKVIRAAKRLADSLGANWVAAHVDTPEAERLPPEDRARMLTHLRRAERLGAETVTLTGDDPVTETINYAQQRNVTKIVIGKSEPGRRRFRRAASLVDRLIRDSGEIDVYVIRGTAEPTHEAAPVAKAAFHWEPWLGTGLVLAATTAANFLLHLLGLTEANLVMAYLMGVVFVAYRYGRGPSVCASLLSVLLFDVLFTEPYFTVAVRDAQYFVTFGVMLLVGLSIAALTGRARRQAEVSRRNERRTEALYRLGRKLAGINGEDFIAAEAERAVSEVLGGKTAVFLPRDGSLRPILDHRASFAASPAEIAVAQWVFDNGQMAGRGTDTLPSAQALHLPLESPNGTVGVLAVRHEDPTQLLLPEFRQILENYATQVAMAIDRDRLTVESHAARMEIETEKLRSTLLSSVSHDLRTPLAAIAGAASSLIQAHDSLDPHTRTELLETICDQSHRLSRLVENLLHMTRLARGRVTVNRQWHPLDEVIGSALNRLGRELADRPVHVDLPEDLPLAHFDDVLVEQLLINLLDNAAKYSEPGTPIEIRVEPQNGGVAVEVSDRGRGLAAGDEERVFDMFFRGGDGNTDKRGSGLGLAICKGIATAHGGTIRAANRPGGGTAIRLTLPFDGKPPVVNVAGEERIRA